MNKEELKLLQSLPLKIKVVKTKQRIREWINYHGRENIYVSFSGGKDSTVLAHLVQEVEKEIYGDLKIPLVFSNTGLEFPEIVSFVNTFDNVEVIRPKMTFVEVIKKYGYPVVSKDVASNIHKLRKQNLSPRFRNYLLYGDERGSFGTVPKKWHYLLDVDFEISNSCCKVMKVRPLMQYEKRTGRNAPFIGTMAEESRRRELQYLKVGCNSYNSKKGYKSTPLGFWTQNDILTYIVENQIKIADVYGDVVVDYIDTSNNKVIYKTTKENRTGCIYCLYGIHLEKGQNRFQRLELTHPQLHDYCIRGGIYEEKTWVPYKGLGIGHVLDTLGVEYKNKAGE